MGDGLDWRLSDDRRSIRIESTSERFEIPLEALDEVNVDPREADPTQLAWKASRGLNLDVATDLREIQVGTRRGDAAPIDEQPAGTGVMLDSTTLRSVEDMVVGDSSPSELGLFDLETFVYATALFETVYVTPNPDVETANEWFDQPVFSVLEPESDLDEDALYWLSIRVKSYLEELPSEEERELTRVWADFFDVDPSAIGFDWDEVDTWLYSPPEMYRNLSRELFEVWSDDKFISVSTYRALFNHELARCLGLTYLPNSVRCPIEMALIQRVDRKRPMFDAAIAEFERTLREDVESANRRAPDGRRYVELTLPMFLAYLLQAVSEPDEVYPEVAGLREEAAPLRATLPDLAEAYQRGDLDEIERIRDVANGKASSIADSFGVSTAKSVLRIGANVPILPETVTGVATVL